MKTVLHPFVCCPASLFVSHLPYHFRKRLFKKSLVTICKDHLSGREPFIADIEGISVKMRAIGRRVAVVSAETLQMVWSSCH